MWESLHKLWADLFILMLAEKKKKKKTWPYIPIPVLLRFLSSTYFDHMPHHVTHLFLGWAMFTTHPLYDSFLILTRFVTCSFYLTLYDSFLIMTHFLFWLTS